MHRLPRHIGTTLLVAAVITLAACGSGASSGSATGNSTSPPDIQTRAELRCAGVSGPLDMLQIPLSNALTSQLSGQANMATISDLGTLVVETLDLVDAVAQAAGTLNPDATGQSAALLEPVVDQLLCTTAAVGETLLELSLAATTPLAQRNELNGLLDIIVDLQGQLTDALRSLGNGGTVPAVANVVQQVTNTLGSVLASPLGLGTLPGGAAIVGVLNPLSTLLLEVSHSMTALSAGDEALFVDELLGSVTHLVESLAASLGPLGVALTAVLNLLTPVLAIVGSLLTGLLGLVV